MTASNGEELVGRLAIVDDLVPDTDQTLSIGCKETELADVNVDIDESVRPDVLCDACRLPFGSDSFDAVVFTAVLNVIPPANELQALEEIYRILRTDGKFVLTVPNDVWLYQTLDLGRFVSGARTYTNSEIRGLLEKAGFDIEIQFTRGDVFEPIEYLWYCLVTVPLATLWPERNWTYAPEPLMRRSQAGYENSEQVTAGRTIFVRAQKA